MASIILVTTVLDRSAAPAPASAASGRAGRVARAAIAPGMGVAAALVSLVGAGNPSYWGDEAASVMSAERPWWSLARELRHIDAVHGLYYSLLHLWIHVAGATELATRFPSVLAAGFSVAGIVVLGRRLFDLRVGVIAGAVLAVLPEFTRMAIETRSYSLDIAAAIWVTVLVARLVGDPPSSIRMRRIGWAGYAIGLGAAITLFEFLGFLLLIHAVLIWALHADRATGRRWLVAASAGLLLGAPLIVVAFLQRGQLAFLALRDYATPKNVIVTQWFGTPTVAIVGWAAILGAVVAAVLIAHRRRTTVAILAWTVVPTATLLIVDAVAMPIYNLRYPSISLGGVALAIAVGIDALGILLRRRGLAIAATSAVLAVLIVGAWPKYLAQRGPYAKGGGSDIRASSALLAELARPGDAVVFDRTVKPSERPSMAYRLYPDDFAGLDNVALQSPWDRNPGIWDHYLSADQLGPQLTGHPVVWADEIRGTASADLAALKDLGYRVTATRTVHRTVLYRMERTAP